MKNYTLKHKTLSLLENDTSTDNTGVLLKKVEALKSGSEQSTKEFTTYIHDEYKISDGISFGSIIKTLLKGVIAVGSGYGMIKMVGKVVEYGNNIVNNLPIVQSIALPSNKAFVFAGGTLWWLVPCFLACFAIMILYKMFTWALKKPVKENYSPTDAKLIELYNDLMLKKSLIQSNKLINQLKYITESENPKKNKSKQEAVLNSVVSKATPKCEGMLDKIIHSTQNFLHKYRRLIAVILICIGLVLSFKNLQTFTGKLANAKDSGLGWVANKMDIAKPWQAGATVVDNNSIGNWTFKIASWFTNLGKG